MVWRKEWDHSPSFRMFDAHQAVMTTSGIAIPPKKPQSTVPIPVGAQYYMRLGVYVMPGHLYVCFDFFLQLCMFLHFSSDLNVLTP